MKISDVESSLSLGNILNSKQLVGLYFAIGICSLFPAITLLLVIIPEVEWTTPLIVLFSLADTIAVSFLGVLIYIKIKDTRVKNKVANWLKDSIVLLAYCKIIDEIRLGIQPKATKI